MDFLQGNTSTTANHWHERAHDVRSRSQSRLLGLLVAVLLLFAHPDMVTEAQDNHQNHIVRTGETLLSIARQYNTTIARIRQLNDLTEGDILYVGNTLIVPLSHATSLSPSSTRSSVSTTCRATHKVRVGESLWSVARRHNATTTAIAQANGIAKHQLIWVGQALCIPGTPNPPPPVPRTSLAPRTASQPQPSTASYTVRGGDTLFAIARAHGVSVQELMAANGISDARILYPGQVLQLPDSGIVDTVATTPRPTAPEATTGLFTVQFFNNLNFSGPPALTQRVIPGTKYDWGLGGPGPTVNPDNFTALLEGQFNFAEGLHRFTVTVDDGMRLFVDDKLVHEAWHDQVATTHEVDVQMTAGMHPVRLEYYERTSRATLWLRWRPLPAGAVATPRVVPVAPQPPTDAFKLQFFNNVNMSGSPVLTKVVPVGQRFDWGAGSPGPQVRKDNFSARMEGIFHFTEGPYRFSITLDDGARLYIDGDLAIDAWADFPSRTNSADVEMSAGAHHIRLEYYERGGLAELWLRWQSLAPGARLEHHSELTPPVLGSGGYTDETKASLFAAIDVRDISTVRKIIATSGFPHFHYNDDGTALHLAAQRDALEIMRLLLSYPEANPNVTYHAVNRNPWDLFRTPLHDAAAKGYTQMVELLLSQGADLGATAGEDFTALHFAARGNHHKTVETLLKHGADPNAQEQRHGRTPVHLAVRAGSGPESLDILLRHSRTRHNAVDYNGKTPLHKAATGDNVVQVALLLNHPETNPNKRDESDATPLYWAVANQRKYVVRELLDHRKTDPNIPEKNGWTPLDRAVYYQFPDIVRELMKHDDTDPEIENPWGWSALQYAKDNGYDDMVRMMD